MPALLLILILVLLLAGCVPGRAAPGRAPSADAPFTLTAFDVGHPTRSLRGQNARVRRFGQLQPSD